MKTMVLSRRRRRDGGAVKIRLGRLAQAGAKEKTAKYRRKRRRDSRRQGPVARRKRKKEKKRGGVVYRCGEAGFCATTSTQTRYPYKYEDGILVSIPCPIYSVK